MIGVVEFIRKCSNVVTNMADIVDKKGVKCNNRPIII